MTSFDPVLKIRELDHRVRELEKTVLVLTDEVGSRLENPRPYATTDAADQGTRLVQSTEAGTLGDATLAALREAGYSTVEEIREAFDEELLAISGIGPKTLKQIRLQIG